MEDLFGIEKVCVSEYPVEVTKYSIWRTFGEDPTRCYFRNELSGKSLWGKRRDTKLFNSEGLARAEWNRLKAGFGWTADIDAVDDCEGI